VCIWICLYIATYVLGKKKHSSFAYLVVGYLEGNQIFLASIIIRMHQKCFMEMKKFKQRTGL